MARSACRGPPEYPVGTGHALRERRGRGASRPLGLGAAAGRPGGAGLGLARACAPAGPHVGGDRRPGDPGGGQKSPRSQLELEGLAVAHVGQGE